MIIKRLVPYLVAAASIGLFALGLIWPQRWFLVGLGLVLLPLLAALLMHQTIWRLEWIGLTMPMIILLLGTYTFMLIQENWWWQVAGAGVAVLCFFLFEKNIAVFLFQPTKYVPYSLEHISMYCTTVAAFFCYVSLAIFVGLHLGRLRYLFIVGERCGGLFW